MFRAFLVAAALLVAAPVRAETPAMSPEQRAVIEQIVREYLVEHPEVLKEAFQNLERRENEATARAQADATARFADQLYRTGRNAVLGNPNGDVTVVEFFDYNCGFCKRSLADMEKLLKSDPNLRIVLREFPVLGPGSVEAAQISAQLISEPRFSEFHIRLLGQREHVDKRVALQIAREFGFDTAKLEAGMTSPASRDVIEESLNLATNLTIGGTPTYVIGNEVVVGAVGYDSLAEKIKSMRQCGHATC